MKIRERKNEKDLRNKKKKTFEETKQYKEEKHFDDQIEGRNAVLELLESGKDINKIYMTKHTIIVKTKLIRLINLFVYIIKF